MGVILGKIKEEIAQEYDHSDADKSEEEWSSQASEVSENSATDPSPISPISESLTEQPVETPSADLPENQQHRTPAPTSQSK